MTDQTQPTPKPKRRPRPRSRAIVPVAPAPPVLLDFNNADGFALAQRRAAALAGSSVVPEAFRGQMGSEGYCNTLIALELAHRLNYPPLLVMQNLSVVDGRPGWQGKFYIALVQSGGVFKDHDWEWKGEPGQDEYGARMVAVRVSDGKRCEGQWVDVKLAKAEGWWSKQKNGREFSKWPAMTAQMLVYRSASFWTHQWNPSATLGIRSVEEVIDTLHTEAASERALSAPPPPVAAPQLAPTLPREIFTGTPQQQEVAARAMEGAMAREQTVELDRTLEPGFDPPAMADPDAEIRRAIAEGAFPRALTAITSLPPGPRKDALKREYSAAKSKR
jgi:hypothetical protein